MQLLTIGSESRGRPGVRAAPPVPAWAGRSWPGVCSALCDSDSAVSLVRSTVSFPPLGLGGPRNLCEPVT